jgi:hypothetical protein
LVLKRQRLIDIVNILKPYLRPITHNTDRTGFVTA